jgi:hypothetical protein
MATKKETENTNLAIWDQIAQPPESALRTITDGRLKGKFDINPQWRYKAMTEVFGPCGIGWKFEVTQTDTFAGSDDQVFAFAAVNLYIKHNGEWSEPIPGSGGDFLVKKEKRGPYCNDEGFKMAITDALGAAMKMIGMAADVYSGFLDSKYTNAEEPRNAPPVAPPAPAVYPTERITKQQHARFEQLMGYTKTDREALRAKVAPTLGLTPEELHFNEIPKDVASALIEKLEAKFDKILAAAGDQKQEGDPF